MQIVPKRLPTETDLALEMLLLRKKLEAATQSKGKQADLKRLSGKKKKLLKSYFQMGGKDLGFI